MRKFISVLLALTLVVSMITVAATALSVSDEGVVSAKEAIEAIAEEEGEEIETQRIYFQMPNGNRGGVADDDVVVSKDIIDEETGEVIGTEDYVAIHAGEKAPSWYSDYNVVDGQHYAGAYWWGGTGACDSWVGYRAEIEDYEQGIYYVDVPKDVVIMIWNNGVDGGTDSSQPIYFEAAQTVDTNIEGAYEGDYDSLPYGSPDNDLFDGCIYVVDPNQVSINAFSQKQTCGANWYVYYGNGCYGEEYAPGGDNNDYPDGTDNWSEDVADICMNPDHFVDGVHVGYHEEETTAPETQAPETQAPETQAPETQAPETQAPETQAPETQAPETQAPETQAPETQAPETQAPTAAPTSAPETQAPETVVPETVEPETEAAYYVVGTISNWAPAEEFRMTKTEAGKYLLQNLDITATTQFKVVKVEDGNQTWYPDGMGNNYGENGEVTQPGVYDVYFDPDFATSEWFYNCIFVDGMPAPETTAPETQEPGTESDVKPIEALPFCDEITADAEETFTVYFQMPMDGEINWANDYNEIDGVNYAGIYWWQSAQGLNPAAWPGFKMTLVDAEQGIFSANVPYESDVLTTIIFNNAIDGGTDKTADVYSAAHQTANLNCQGAEEDEIDTIPEGTLVDNFDGCIFIVDPDTLDVNKFSGKDTIDGNWYVYYGNGCYGMYAEYSDNFVSAEENCCNPLHDHGHEVPTQPATQEPSTEEPVAQGNYYIVGNMTGWAIDEAYMMTPDNGVDPMYKYTMDLTTESQFKVVYFDGKTQTWMPDGMGNNYGENGEITVDGTYDIYFRPNVDGDETWFYGCIKAELQDPGAYYIVGNMTGWAPQEEYKMTEDGDLYKYEMTLNTDSQFKVVFVQDGEQTWIPDGMGNNYGENGEIIESGFYTISFDPTISSDGWFYNCINAVKNEGYFIGDANSDLEVDTLDATIIQRVDCHFKVPYDQATLMQADVDGDGELTIVDATFIQRYATNIATPAAYNIGGWCPAD